MAGTAPATEINVVGPASGRRSVRRSSRALRSKPFVIGGSIVLFITLAAVFAGLIAPYDPNAQNYTALLQAPGIHHWLGTDEVGRDTLSRILFGARTSMEVSLGAVVFGLVIGIPVGLVSGYYRGFVDNWIIMRIVDALQAFPFLILALVLAAMLGPGIGNAMMAIGIGYVPSFVRIIRGQIIAEMGKEYVLSARMIGARDGRIMFYHVLRNITTPLIVQVSIAMASGIVAEASLSYLGLGAQPPTASWGAMLHTAQGYLTQAPWESIVPGVAIAIAVFGFNMFGDGLQEVWDPRALQ